MYWIFLFLEFLFPQKFLLLDTWKEDLTSVTEDSVKSLGFFCCNTENDDFFSQKQFLAKNFLGTRSAVLMTLQLFCQKPENHKLKVGKWWKYFSIVKNIFLPKISSGAVAWKSLAQSQKLKGLFFSQKKFAKHPRKFRWQSKKEEYDKYFDKSFSPIVSSGHERFSFNNPTEKFLAIHPHFLSLGMRGCEAQIPNRIFTQKPPFVLEVVQFSFEFFSSKCVL